MRIVRATSTLAIDVIRPILTNVVDLEADQLCQVLEGLMTENPGRTCVLVQFGQEEQQDEPQLQAVLVAFAPEVGDYVQCIFDWSRTGIMTDGMLDCLDTWANSLMKSKLRLQVLPDQTTSLPLEFRLHHRVIEAEIGG